ncbi:MAG: hypothetical protein LBD04_00890 [Synergistaceae bacterium]|jgi:hypothetical protein|nr:hypothetical protein [Synergistaceae bacterium]
MKFSRSRRGVALMMALVVVLTGGVLIAITFSLVSGYVGFATEQRGSYVDHTTVLHLIQSTKAYIVSSNDFRSFDLGVMHAPGFDYSDKSSVVNDVNQLRFPATYDPNLDLVDIPINSGAGRQRATVQVYDMFFEADRVKDPLLSNRTQMQELPPVYKLKGVGADSFESDGGTNVGDPSSGSSDTYSEGELDPMRYGAYLIRVKLYNHNATDPVRVAEEAFVQLLPKSD